MNERLPSILIEAPPAMGKTSSLKSLAADKKIASGVLYISGDDKALPWFGANHFARYTLRCPTELPRIIQSATSQGKFHTIIVDTITRIAENFQSRFIGSKQPKYALDAEGNMITDVNYVAVTKRGDSDSMSGWGRLAALLRDILAAGDVSGCQMIYFSHMSQVLKEDGSFNFQAPIQGQIGKIGLESYFTICLVARCLDVSELQSEPESPLVGKEESRPGTGTRYVFQVEKTENTKSYPVRVIDGMFEEGLHYIDNDLLKLITHLKELYAKQGNTVVF